VAVLSAHEVSNLGGVTHFARAYGVAPDSRGRTSRRFSGPAGVCAESDTEGASLCCYEAVDEDSEAAHTEVRAAEVDAVEACEVGF